MNEAPRLRIAPVLIGIGITIIFLVVLGYLAKHRAASEAQRAPHLSIVAPLDHAVVDSPLMIRFVSEQPIVLDSTGWGYGDLHLHAWVAGIQQMPAASDITRYDSTYTWRLPSIGRGDQWVHLGWADQQHRALSQGASDSILVTVR
jgi:hypothetical protein